VAAPAAARCAALPADDRLARRCLRRRPQWPRLATAGPL